MNKHRMYVNRSRHTQDFNKFITPTDSLSRTRVSDFELALRKHYPTMGFQSITNFKKVKELPFTGRKMCVLSVDFIYKSQGRLKYDIKITTNNLLYSQRTS